MAAMNRFEQAVHDCMIPTANLLDQTVKPLHRAMLFNFWRHVHLEGAGEYGQIVAPDMMVDHPVYRITWGANPAVIEGKDGVLGFYHSVGEAVLWNSDDRLAVADWVSATSSPSTSSRSARICRRSATTSVIPLACITYPAVRRSSGPMTSGPCWPGRTCTRTRPACVSSRSTRLRPPRPRGSVRSTASSWPSSRMNAGTSSGYWTAPDRFT